MAGSFVYKEQNEKYDYIKDVFDTLITRDIIQKFNIKNTALLEKLNNFLLDNISSKISARKIYTGVLYKKEIDFVAIKQSEKIYIQVSDNIQVKETFEGIIIYDLARWLKDY